MSFSKTTSSQGIGSPLLLIKSKVAFLLQQKEMTLINLKLKRGEKWIDMGEKRVREL